MEIKLYLYCSYRLNIQTVGVKMKGYLIHGMTTLKINSLQPMTPHDLAWPMNSSVSIAKNGNLARCI